MALAKIITSVIGPGRLPMIVVDTASLVRDRRRFSARAAGVLGLTTFGRQHFYALDDAMELDLAGLRSFLDRFGGEPFLMFGFTFMVWQYLYRRIESLGLDLSRGILFHSGGWKALQEAAVSSAEFRRLFHERTGLARIYNFYGMVEQVGSIFLEGDDGYLYPPNFADVIVRDPVTLAPAPAGVPGIIQVLSALPQELPGALDPHRGSGYLPRRRRLGVRPLRPPLLRPRTRAADRAARLQRRPGAPSRPRVNVTQVVPASSEPVPLDRLLAGLRDPAARPRPWAPETLELAHRLSRALFHDPAARAFPELQALAFWLRKSEMSRLQTQFDAGKAGSTVLVPRGLVFHVPPSNVDTIFIYSWIVSALAGNANLIRLSDRAGNATVAVCRLFAEALKDAPDVLRSSTAIIRYDRSDEITAAISMACDVRVLWGGDASVNALRAFAVPPHARDLTFPDRHSFSLIKAASYAASPTPPGASWPRASTTTRSGSTRRRARHRGSSCGSASSRRARWRPRSSSTRSPRKSGRRSTTCRPGRASTSSPSPTAPSSTARSTRTARSAPRSPSCASPASGRSRASTAGRPPVPGVGPGGRGDRESRGTQGPDAPPTSGSTPPSSASWPSR